MKYNLEEVVGMGLTLTVIIMFLTAFIGFAITYTIAVLKALLTILVFLVMVLGLGYLGCELLSE